MPSAQVLPPFEAFMDIDGNPLDDGFIYIGVDTLDPETNPTSVFFDPSLTIPATQPIRTKGGYPLNSGNPAQIYIGPSSYSIRVKNKNSTTVHSDLSIMSPTDAASISFVQAGVGAVERDAQDKMRETVSVKDFGAVGDGVTDDTAALNAAHLVAKLSKYELHYPDGDYRVTDTIIACSHTNFSLGARIMHYGFTDDKDVYRIPGDKPLTSHFNVQVYAGLGEFETPATYSGRGIVVAYREGNVNTFGAYNTHLYNPRVRFCAWGLIIRSFQQVVITPDISDCKTGFSIAGTSGSNESGVVNTVGGWIRNCVDYAAYPGDPRVLPVTTNNLNGTTINFQGTQFLGTVRATKVAALAFPHCHFENHGYGNGTALQIDTGCYNVFADDCYFGGYDYAVKCTAQVNGTLSVKRPTAFGNRKNIVYFFQPPGRLEVDTAVYTGGTNHDKGPMFHFGMPQDTTPVIAPLFKYINWRGIGFTIEAGRQAGTSSVDVALGGAVRKETDGDYVNIGIPLNVGMGLYRTTPATGISGVLAAVGTAGYKFTLDTLAQISSFAAGDVVSCTSGGTTNNIITSVDYELGVISLSTSFAASPTAGTISQIAPTWVKRRSVGNFTPNNVSSYPVADTSVTSTSIIDIMANDANAAVLKGGAKAVWASRNPGVGFNLLTADGSTMGASAPNFSYSVTNN